MGWLKTFKPNAEMPTDAFELQLHFICFSFCLAAGFLVSVAASFLVCNVAGILSG